MCLWCDWERFTSYLHCDWCRVGRRGLVDERLVDVRDDSITGNGCLDKGVQLFITSDGKEQMSWGDSLNLKILTGVTSKLKHLCCQIFHDSGCVDGGCCTNTLVRVDSCFQKSVDTTDRELKAGTRRTGLRGTLGTDTLSSLSTFSSLSAFSFTLCTRS